MNFDTGSISFRMLELPRPLPADFIQQFAIHAAKPLDAVSSGEQRGWVTGRHLLDADITETTATYGGYVRMALRRAERVIPSALLKAECRAEELAFMAATGRVYLKSRERAEIRRAVVERLLPTVPPTLRAIPFVYEPGTGHMFVGCTTETQMDIFQAALTATLGFCGERSTPEVLGKTLANTDLSELSGSIFSPSSGPEGIQHAPGREFLTWLWFSSDTSGSRIHVENGPPLLVMVEGPMRFFHEGNGAFSAVLSKGLPENSLEAKSCLLANKKLQQARVVFCRNDETQWHFTLSADDFTVKGMKLPPTESLDAVSRFQERMAFLDAWRNDFQMVYKAYLTLRTDPRAWSLELARIREWIATKPARS